MKKVLELLAGLFVFVSIANAQPYYFRHHGVENGLSNTTVYSITQDKNGFVWSGTKDGLNRFDGYRFKTFRNADNASPEKNLILSLTTAQKGTVWVGSQKGLFYFDAVKEVLHPFLDTVNAISHIFFDTAGQLWFIADRMACRYNFNTKKLTKFPTDQFFSASSICETPDGSIWFGTFDGELKQLEPSAQSFKSYNVFSHSPQAESNMIHKILYNKKGSILVGTTNQGIKEFNLDKRKYKDLLMYNPDKTTIFIRDILLVNDNETWLATESGIYIWNHANGKFLHLKKKYLDPYSLSDNSIYTLYKDSEQGIWAGTFFGGLNYYPKQLTTFKKYFPDYSNNSISGKIVREICEDRAGNIWIGTEDAGLNRLEVKTGEITHFSPTGKPGSINFYNIHGLLVVKDELWVGTFEHGLDVLDIHTGKVKKRYQAGSGPYDLKSNFIISLLQTRNGDIYVGTAWRLYRYNRKDDNFKAVTKGGFITCLLEDHQGTIWIGTHNGGLSFLNPATGAEGHFESEPGNKNSLSANSINSIHEDSNRNLWFATEGGGLCNLDKSRRNFTSYNTKNGLPSNFVFKVLQDNNKTFWLSTSKGLVNLDITRGQRTVYTRANGLINDQFNYNSGYKDKEGNLYFGSVQGMIKFNPASFRKDNYLPPVYITGFQVQNKEVEFGRDQDILQKSIIYTDKIKLPHDQSSFSIDFAALRFTSPETTVYGYIMKGIDKEWTYLPANRKVYFTNLKPGSYTFEVKAGNNGAWGSTKALSIVITPPFWATSWAYVCYLLAAVSLLYYIIRTYHDIQKNKKEKEIYQAKLEFFTNIAHEIRTPLTLIKGPVENLSEMTGQTPEIRDDVNTLERNTDRLVNLVNQILDFRQTEAKGFRLDFSEVNIIEIIKEAYLTFQPLAKKRMFAYTMELPATELNIMADAEGLTKILNNLLSNALKYAEKEVTLQVFPAGQNENMVVVEISNDGSIIPEELKEKIFEPFFRIKNNSKQKGTGLGLALVRSLVELHNGKVYIKTQEGKRNLFIVELPLSASASKINIR